MLVHEIGFLSPLQGIIQTGSAGLWHVSNTQLALIIYNNIHISGTLVFWDCHMYNPCMYNNVEENFQQLLMTDSLFIRVVIGDIKYSKLLTLSVVISLVAINNHHLSRPTLLLIKSPKQKLGDLLFLLRFLLLFLFLLLLFLFFSFLSANHELVHGRSQELQDRISWNLVEL